MDKYDLVVSQMYKEILRLKPNVVVELGTGIGRTTRAISLALKDLNSGGKLYSYEKNDISGSFNPVKENLEMDELISFVELHQCDIWDSWIESPFRFDVLYIDFGLDWEGMYKIIENKFINSQIKDGATVLFEGGSDNHTRINKFTLDEFNKFKNTSISFKHLVGNRTSLSILTGI